MHLFVLTAGCSSVPDNISPVQVDISEQIKKDLSPVTIYVYGMDELRRTAVPKMLERDGIEYKVIDIDSRSEYPELWKKLEEMKGPDPSFPYPGIITADGKLHLTRNYYQFKKNLKPAHLPLEVYGSGSCYWTNKFKAGLDKDKVPYKFIDVNQRTDEMLSAYEKVHGRSGGAFYPPVIVSANGHVIDNRMSYGNLLEQAGVFYQHGNPNQLNPVPFFQYKGMDISEDDLNEISAIELNQWSSYGLKFLKALPNLEKVRIIGGQYKPSDCGVFKKFPVKEIYINTNTFKNQSLASIASISSIERLFISSTSVTPSALHYLKRMKSLKEIGLYGIKIDRSAMNAITAINGLEDLILSPSYMEPGVLSGLVKIRSLKRLNLSRADVRSSDIDILLKLKNLDVLMVKRNNLSSEDIQRLRDGMPQSTNLSVY